jgi:leucyl/phenylalanyl-tRNA--protein transferase
MQKVLSRGIFDIRFDTAFPQVITNCARVERPGQNGTWITRDMIAAYIELFRLGFAHSAEAWEDGELRGGCYGVLLGKVFFGESMFARKPDSSKAAFLTYAQRLFSEGITFIDCQVWTAHLESLGGAEMSRADFLNLLARELPPPLNRPGGPSPP